MRISGLPEPALAANGDYSRYSATPELNGRPVFAQQGSAAKNFLWHDGHSWSLGPEIDGEQVLFLPTFPAAFWSSRADV